MCKIEFLLTYILPMGNFFYMTKVAVFLLWVFMPFFVTHSYINRTTALKVNRILALLWPIHSRPWKWQYNIISRRVENRAIKNRQSVSTRGYCQRKCTKESLTVQTCIDVHKCSHDNYNSKGKIGEFRHTKKWDEMMSIIPSPFFRTRRSCRN